MSNPVSDGLADGLKPSIDTIPARDLALMSIAAKIDRLSEASERQAMATKLAAEVCDQGVSRLTSFRMKSYQSANCLRQTCPRQMTWTA